MQIWPYICDIEINKQTLTTMRTFKNFTTIPERPEEFGLTLFCQTNGELPCEEGDWVECDESELKKAIKKNNVIKLWSIPTLDQYFGWL